MLVYQRVFREPWEPPTVRWCWNTAHAAKHIVNVGHSKLQSAFLFGLLRADSDELIGHSLLQSQWFVLSSLKCLFYFHWMSMNQQCFFSNTPIFWEKISSGFWLTPVIRSAAKGWIEAQRQLGLFLLSRGMMHQEVPVLSCCPPISFGVGRGILEEKWGGWFWDFGNETMEEPRCFGLSEDLSIWSGDFLWSEDSAVVMGVTFFLAFTTVLAIFGDLRGFCTGLFLKVLTSFW